LLESYFDLKKELPYRLAKNWNKKGRLLFYKKLSVSFSLSIIFYYYHQDGWLRNE